MAPPTSSEASSGKTGKEVDVLGFIKYLLEKKNILILVSIMAFLFSAIYVFAIAVPEYEATSQIYVVNSKDSVINLSDLQIGSYLTSDYQWIFQTWEVNQSVIDRLNLKYTVKQMQKRLTVKNPNNTRVLTISFLSPDPREAADVANEYASIASQYISESMLTNKPTTISVALEPLKPARPRKLLVIAICTLLSAFICAWIMFIVFLLDDKIKNEEDLKRYLDAVPLAMIPASQQGGHGLHAESNEKQG